MDTFTGRSDDAAMTYDAVVVGGGFAGLSAADALSRQGKKVCVLEARDRVGGRVATTHLEDGTPIDIGGQWLGPTQDRIYALCKRFGHEVYAMHQDGRNTLSLAGKRRSYRGHIPLRAPPWTLANLGWVLLRLHQLAQRVPLEAPWQAPHAAALDQQTLGDWVRRNIPDGHARAMVNVGIEAVFAANADELSLLHALFYMRSGGSFDQLTRSEGGAQQDRVTGGMQSVAESLATAIGAAGGRLELDWPVTRMTQDDDGVVVAGARGEVRGRYAVIALPPPLVVELEMSPPLSDERRALMEQLPMGAVIKCIAAYDAPFWRARGFSGQSVSDEGPVHATFDASPKSGKPGLLMGFIEGPTARELASWTTEQRRQVVLGCFARAFGPEASDARQYVDRAWTAEAYSRGCYAALFPPGAWTKHGHVLRLPEGRVHWAGTETATVWNGYIDGAIRSGERAAQEVLKRV